ncbi:MAG: cob(I)yrinic acid a,c-diamide adenosyltransferase [Rheinheimera sp.]|nr:cob(I)yrinic acid a,c-diamide adenosyltransferase [Rheinheimera sp.]
MGGNDWRVWHCHQEAVGRSTAAAVAQFIKGTWECGERNLLQKHGVPFSVMATGFTWETQDRALDIAAATQVWEDCAAYLQDPTIDVVLLDRADLYVELRLSRLSHRVRCHSKPPRTLACGDYRKPQRSSTTCCSLDTVSEVQSVKHAFDAGIKVQKGIDW